MTSRTRIAAPALIALAAVTLPLSAQQQAPFSVAETGRGYATLQDAVDAIGAGTGTVVFAPGTYNECAVQRAGDITYRAMEPGSATLSGVACEGKGALVLGGEAATVIGLVFSDIAVPDRNGAGIRLESGDLAVTQSWFRDSEQGILTAHDPNIHLRIDKSTFTRLGTCEGDGGCAHSIYTGEIAETAVTRSRYEAGTGGHYLKSRAARTIVEDSSFDDAAGRGTNYMIEQANYSSDGLVIADNDARLAPGLSRSPAFIADWTGDRLSIANNELGAGLKPFERR